MPLVQELMGVTLHTRLRCEEGDEEIVEDSTVFELKACPSLGHQRSSVNLFCNPLQAFYDPRGIAEEVHTENNLLKKRTALLFGR